MKSLSCLALSAFVALGVLAGCTPHEGVYYDRANWQAHIAPMVSIKSGKQFKQVLEQTDRPVLVKFYYPDCCHCRFLAPTMSQLIAEYNGKVLFAKIDKEQCPRLVEQLRVNQFPTVMIFRQGKRARPYLIGRYPIEVYREELGFLLES